MLHRLVRDCTAAPPNDLGLTEMEEGLACFHRGFRPEPPITPTWWFTDVGIGSKSSMFTPKWMRENKKITLPMGFGPSLGGGNCLPIHEHPGSSLALTHDRQKKAEVMQKRLFSKKNVVALFVFSEGGDVMTKQTTIR